MYDSINFFQNPKIRDLSSLACLSNVKFLLFYNLRVAKQLWDMSRNVSLKGLLIDYSPKMVYDISPIANAPALEELLIFGTLDRGYTIQTLEPIKQNKTLKRVMIECKTEHDDFDPSEFSGLEVFQYRVDRHRNYKY